MLVSRPALIRQAQTAFAQRDFLRAQNLCQQLLRQNRSDGEALVLMHHIALRQARLQEAVSYLEQFIKFFPNNPVGYVHMGDYFLRSGRYREAVSRFQKALSVHANHQAALTLLARTYDMMGESQKAQALLAPHIGTPRENAGIAFSYANLEIDAKRYQRAIDALLRHVHDTTAPPQLRRELWFVLGKAYERSGDVDKAFEAYSSAHAIAPFPYDFEGYKSRIKQIMDVFSLESLSKLPRAKNDSRLAVFIVSRPRAGSTLVERILAAHPDVHSAGENENISTLAGRLNLIIGSERMYPHCVLNLNQHWVDALGQQQIDELQKLDAKAKRVTVKHLFIWGHLGLLELLMPNACIIDLRRDPVDNGLACFSESLGVLLPFQGDLRLVGIAHRLYERLMEHWHKVLKLRMFQLQYEDLVAEPELWTRRIVEFAGLKWDDRCLEFHQNKAAVGSSTAAPTLSYQQVRQPIYKASVGRAAKFAKHLGPLLKGLNEEVIF